MLRKRPLAETAAAIAAAVLLSLAYPPLASADAAFFALVPLLVALRHASPRRGFTLGFAFGFAFRLVNLSWLLALKDNGGPLSLVAVGLLALAAYCALYTGLFGFAAACLWSVARRPGLPAPLAFRAFAWIAEPLLWTGSEYLVGSVLTGFPWNPLAATQYKNLALLSCVAVGGAGLLSALVASVNSGIASLVIRIWKDAIAPRFAKIGVPRAAAPRSKMPRTIPLFLSLITLIAVWWRGMDAVRHADRAALAAPKFRIALVHPDLPCIFERDYESFLKANQALLDYTEIAGATGPDATLWPETSLPGLMPYDRDAATMIDQACKTTGGPLIAGGVEYVPRPGAEGDAIDDGLFFNSAFLFIPGPAIAATYRKQHLVPMGEYIPLESVFPILKKCAPAGFSCEAGLEQVYFPVMARAAETNGASTLIAPLICFEDVFPYLAREAAAEGASAIASLANDAWFDGTAEAEQHLAQAVLRAVETGLPVLRSTNKGVTAFILPNGRIVRRLGSGRGSGTPGFITTDIGIAPKPAGTFYVRHGDAIFSIPCAGFLGGIALAAGIIGRAARRRRRQ